MKKQVRQNAMSNKKQSVEKRSHRERLVRRLLDADELKQVTGGVMAICRSCRRCWLG